MALVLPVRETERRLASSRAWFLCHPYGSCPSAPEDATVAKRRRFDPSALRRLLIPGSGLMEPLFVFISPAADRFLAFLAVFQGSCDGIFQIKSTRLRHGQNRYLRCARSNQSVPSNKSAKPDGELLFYFIGNVFLAIVDSVTMMCPLVLMNAAQKVPQFIGADLESDKSYMCARECEDNEKI